MIKVEVLERPMGKRQSNPTVAGGNVARAFPPEAYDYNDDVDPKVIAAMKAEIDTDYDADEWEVVDAAFGHVIHT